MKRLVYPALLQQYGQVKTDLRTLLLRANRTDSQETVTHFYVAIRLT